MDTAQEIGVAEKNRRMNGERDAEISARLEEIGLSEYLADFLKDRWNWHDSYVICDPLGKAVFCRNGWYRHIAEAVGTLFDREIEYLKIGSDENETAVFLSVKSLPVPERHTLATMNRYFDTYRPGLCAGYAEVSLPYAIHALAAPAILVDEGAAYQLAAAVEYIGNVPADVVATDSGYAVVAHDPEGDLNGFFGERLAAVADLACAFDITPKTKEYYGVPTAKGSYDPVPWQASLGERHTQQQRIERKLDALLAATGAAVPAPAAKPARTVDVFEEAEPKDAHQLPAKPTQTGKKSAGKRSA